MILRTIKKICLIFLIIVCIAAPSILKSYLEYYYEVILGGVPTFLIYFLFYVPEIFFVKLLIKKPKKPLPHKEHTVASRRVFYIVSTVLLILLPFGLWHLYQKYQYHVYSFNYDTFVGCTIYIPCLMTALFLIYKFCETLPRPKGSRNLLRRDPIYKQIMDACNQNISVYEEHIRTHLSDMESQNIEARTNAYMNARSAYLCSVIKSFLEIIYASHPSLYFTLVSMPELRKETPDITAGELYSQYMFALKGKRSKASIIRQLDSQQSKLMDEAMIRVTQQREIPTDKAEHHKEILSKLKNRNNIEEKQENEQEVSEYKAKEVPERKAKEEPAYRVKEVPERKTEEEQANETEIEGSLSDNKRMIRIVSFIIAMIVLISTILSIIVSIGGTL